MGGQYIQSYSVCIPKSPQMMKLCFPGDGWTSACWWWVMNYFLALLYLWTQLLLCLLDCLYLNTWVFKLLSLQLSPIPLKGEIIKEPCGAHLPIEVKPQHPFTESIKHFSKSSKPIMCDNNAWEHKSKKVNGRKWK